MRAHPRPVQRSVALLCVIAGLSGCADRDDVSGTYRGTETTQLVRGGNADRGAARARVTVTADGDELTVETAGCRVTLKVVVAGVAELTPGGACTLTAEGEAAGTVALQLGEATFGDGSFGLTLLGIASNGARWEYTFAGRRD